MAALKHLKNLEFTDNKVEKLPAELGTLTNLEVLDACRNKLVGVEALKTLHNLVTLKLDQNAIASLKVLLMCCYCVANVLLLCC
jgi:Leucine-rich repeat (LRR) protein